MNALAVETEAAEREAWEAEEKRLNAYAFYRQEVRHSKRDRVLDCHHRIGPREPYLYTVFKINADTVITQTTECDFCMRRSNRY